MFENCHSFASLAVFTHLEIIVEELIEEGGGSEVEFAATD